MRCDPCLCVSELENLFSLTPVVLQSTPPIDSAFFYHLRLQVSWECPILVLIGELYFNSTTFSFHLGHKSFDLFIFCQKVIHLPHLLIQFFRIAFFGQFGRYIKFYTRVTLRKCAGGLSG